MEMICSLRDRVPYLKYRDKNILLVRIVFGRKDQETQVIVSYL